jgi:hypothetical protein
VTELLCPETQGLLQHKEVQKEGVAEEEQWLLIDQLDATYLESQRLSPGRSRMTDSSGSSLVGIGAGRILAEAQIPSRPVRSDLVDPGLEL